MQHISLTATLVLFATLNLGLALAQDAPRTILFGEYYTCDQNREAYADILVERFLGPSLQKHIDRGHLTGWGWLGHQAGSSWRRVLFYTANDLKTLMDARDQMIEEAEGELLEVSREFTDICPDHDDLIWASVAGNAVPQQLENFGAASYSTYYICDQNRQERADEIVKQLITPAVNKLVASGQIKTWGWYAHVIGGQFRRLMTHSGMSHVDLIQAVTKYNEDASGVNEAMANEFTEICGSHIDYLWNRLLPKR